MGDLHYQADVPKGTMLVNWNSVPRPQALVFRSTFERIGDYTRSQPTGPSAGRIYRKNLGWGTDTPDNWWIYFCEPDPKPGYVAHVPCQAIIMEGC